MNLSRKLITGCLAAGAIATLVAAVPAQAKPEAGRAFGIYKYSGSGNTAQMTHPAYERCYDVALVNASTTGTVTNSTDSNAYIYYTDDCTGEATTIVPGTNSQGFGHRSVKFGTVG